MHYLVATVLAVTGISVLIWSRPLAQKFGRFTAQRHRHTFGGIARTLGWDEPSKHFNIFLHRSLVIIFALFLLLMAFHSWFGTIYIGTAQTTNSLLNTQ
jgi:hypothetical protein